jgi:hypothetical protein
MHPRSRDPLTRRDRNRRRRAARDREQENAAAGAESGSNGSHIDLRRRVVGFSLYGAAFIRYMPLRRTLRYRPPGSR